MKPASDFGRSAGANFLARTWAGLLWLALVPIYLKLLGSEAYGLVGLYLSLSMVVQLLDLGLSPTMTRELARATGERTTLAAMKDLVATAELTSWSVAVIIALGLSTLFHLTASAWLRPGTLANDRIAGALMLAGLAIAAQWPVLFYTGTLSGLHRQTSLARIGAFFATLRGVGAALILWKISATPEAFFLWCAASNLAYSLALGITLRQTRPPELRDGRPKVASLVHIRRFTAAMSVLGTVAVVVTQADKVLLSNWLPLEQYGHYMVAAALATLPQFVVAPVSAALLPELSRALAAGADIAAVATYRRASAWLAVALAAPAALAAMFSEAILFAWSGNATLAGETRVALSLLMTGSCLNGLMCIPYAWQIARGRPGVPIRINVASLCIMLPTLWLGARGFGAAGAALGWTAFNLAYMALNLQSMLSIAPEIQPVDNLLNDMLRAFLAAAAVCAAATALPRPESRLLLGAWLACLLALAATAALLATPRCLNEVRSWLRMRPNVRHD